MSSTSFILKAVVLFLGVGASTAVSTSSSTDVLLASPRTGNLRRGMRDESNNIVTVPSPDGLASVTTTTKNDWHEEGVHFVHIRARFNNLDKQHRPICGITFSIEGFDAANTNTQYGNFDVKSDGSLLIPGTTESSNPLNYHQLTNNPKPDWFIGVIMPFTGTADHPFPDLAIKQVHLCDSTTTASKVTTPATTTTTTP